MDLKHYTHNLIYEGKNMPLSDSLARFKIVCPEYAPHEIEVKPYPIPAAANALSIPPGEYGRKIKTQRN